MKQITETAGFTAFGLFISLILCIVIAIICDYVTDGTVTEKTITVTEKITIGDKHYLRNGDVYYQINNGEFGLVYVGKSYTIKSGERNSIHAITEIKP